jgi:hypothetical protein
MSGFGGRDRERSRGLQVGMFTSIAHKCSVVKKYSWLLSPPKAFEPGRGQLGVPHRVLDVLVSEIRLKRAGVMAFGSQGEPAGMPQHVRMRLESELRLRSSPLDHAREAGGAEG